MKNDNLADMIKNILKKVRSRLRKEKIIWYRKHNLPLKLIIGAAATNQDGWLSTDQSFLDLTDESTWKHLLNDNSIEMLLAEHVWEHLNPNDAFHAAKNVFKYLASGGQIRVAVPDGLNPSKEYIDQVKPGGNGAGSDDHKVLYTYKTLSYLFEQAGFTVKLLEYFDESGKFHRSEWSQSDGKILRSVDFDSRNQDGKINYSSIIIDAKKIV